MLTNGYDYIFALSKDEVNSILINNLTDKSIEVKYKTNDPDSGSTINVNFSLSPWQIVPGGGGKLLYLQLPINSGDLSIEGGSLPNKIYDLTSISVVIQVELGWLGTGDQQQASGSSNIDKLVFSPSTETKDNPGYVSEVTILDPNKQLDIIGRGILSTTVTSALVANKDKLLYIFANVNPTPVRVSSWLNPVKWQYYYVNSETGPSALCFLCQLSNKSFPPQATFDANNLDASNNTLLLISQETFFKNVILPSVNKSFPSGSFSYSVNSEERVTISNDRDFNFGKVTAHSFHLTTSNSGNGLAISASGGGPLKFLFGLANLPDASYSWGITSVNQLNYVNSTINFQKDNNPTKTHDQTIRWYDWVLLAVVGITGIAGIVSAILEAVNDFYDGSNAMGIDNINAQIQGSVDGSVTNLSNLLSWNRTGESFSPSAAGLEVSLYVRGKIS